jgi:hypothetical protein
LNGKRKLEKGDNEIDLQLIKVIRGEVDEVSKFEEVEMEFC